MSKPVKDNTKLLEFAYKKAFGLTGDEVQLPEHKRKIKEALKTGLNCIALSVMHLTIILSQMEKSRKRFRLYGQNSLEEGVSAATMDFLNTEETA